MDNQYLHYQEMVKEFLFSISLYLIELENTDGKDDG